MVHELRQPAMAHAHSKVILIGEHSVVYGKPAIALPFPTLEVTCIIKEIRGPSMIDSDYFSGELEEVPKEMSGIYASIKEGLRKLDKVDANLQIKLYSTIPIGRGLGSSAASALATVRCMNQFYGSRLTDKEIFKLVEIAEKHAHGTPSGIDLETVVSEHPIWFEKGKQPLPLNIQAPLHLVVADTGRIGKTHEAVGAIRSVFHDDRRKIEKSMDKLEQLTYEARAALATGNVKGLGKIMSAAQEELSKLGVSDKGIEDLIAVAQQAGALGAKLTGGGKGGCIIALASNDQQAEMVANELVKYGASQVWFY